MVNMDTRVWGLGSVYIPVVNKGTPRTRNPIIEMPYFSLGAPHFHIFRRGGNSISWMAFESMAFVKGASIIPSVNICIRLMLPLSL